MNITLVTASLQCGGAERVVSLLAQGFVDRGYQVQVVSLSHGSTDFYTLPVGVPVTSLDVMGPSQNPLHAIQANLDRFFKLRRAILQTKPDRIIAHLSQTNILSILATMGSGIPVYVTEHCDAELSAVHNIWEKLRRWVYPWATQVVSVSEGVDRGFRYLPAQKRAVLYNPVVPQPPQGELPHIPGADPHRPWVVTMGRLRSQKGYDLLIPAFAKLAQRYPEWQLIIMGEGSDRESLESLRNGLGLDDRVLMPGTVRNPSAVLHQAELFVMASRFEGFPMAHCEAMSSGLPIVSTDCESGPREIIRQNVDGFLVEPGNIDAIALAMEKLMVNPSLRKQFAQRAPDILDRFGMDKIISQWEALMKINPEVSLASYSQSSRYCNRSGPLTPNSGGT